jgi:hypothetical protein
MEFPPTIWEKTSRNSSILPFGTVFKNWERAARKMVPRFCFMTRIHLPVNPMRKAAG